MAGIVIVVVVGALGRFRSFDYISSECKRLSVALRNSSRSLSAYSLSIFSNAAALPAAALVVPSLKGRSQYNTKAEQRSGRVSAG